MNNKVLDLIKKEKSQNSSITEENKKNVWLIFNIGKKLYAIPSECVKEILRNTEIYPLPFSPDYLNGVVNRYGDPYAVIDPAVLIEEPAQETLLFIVINDETHTCLRITDVKDFYTASENEVVKFVHNDMSDFFEGSLNVNGEEALVIKVQSFLERLGKDIGE